MSDLEKRKWVYVQRPKEYEIDGCSCGNNDPSWSEFKGRLWCAKCQSDFTPARNGIFDGPIGVNTCRLLGIDLRRLNLETQEIESAEGKAMRKPGMTNAENCARRHERKTMKDESKPERVYYEKQGIRICKEDLNWTVATMRKSGARSKVQGEVRAGRPTYHGTLASACAEAAQRIADAGERCTLQDYAERLEGAVSHLKRVLGNAPQDKNVGAPARLQAVSGPVGALHHGSSLERPVSGVPTVKHRGARF